MPIFLPVVMVCYCPGRKILGRPIPLGQNHGWLAVFMLVLLATATSRLLMLSPQLTWIWDKPHAVSTSPVAPDSYCNGVGFCRLRFYLLTGAGRID